MKNLLTVVLLFASIFCFAQKKDSDPTRDAFGRFRVSQAESLFDGQFTYDRQPLLFDTITVGDSVSISYDNTNKEVDMIMANALPGMKVGMQTFEHFRYQPGKSQLILITFNAGGAVAGVQKSFGYSDGTNGIEFVLDGTTPKFRILSATDEGNEEVSQIPASYVVSGAAASSGESTVSTNWKYPLTLDHEGAQRALGRMSILAQGIGGTSAVRCTAIWDEIR